MKCYPHLSIIAFLQFGGRRVFKKRMLITWFSVTNATTDETWLHLVTRYEDWMMRCVRPHCSCDIVLVCGDLLCPQTPDKDDEWTLLSHIYTLLCTLYTAQRPHRLIFGCRESLKKKKMQLQDCVTVSLYVLRFTSPQGTIVCIVCVHSLLIMSDIHNSRKDNWHAWRGCLNCPHGSKCVPTQTGMCSSDALVILMYKLYNWLLCCMIECNCLVMHVQLRQPCTDFLYSPQIVVLVELHL